MSESKGLPLFNTFGYQRNLFCQIWSKKYKIRCSPIIISKPSRNILSHQVPNPLFFTLYPLITYCLSKQSIIVHYIYKIAIKNSQISIYIKIYVSIMMQYFIMSWYCIMSQCSIILLPCITSWPSVALWPGIASWSNHILWPSIAPWLCIPL